MGNPFDLKDKVFLVTGASSGIGFEICRTIHAMNGRFIAVARREERLQALVADLDSTRHTFKATDLTQEDQLDDLIASLPAIDGVVHCAGAGKYLPLRFYNFDVFRELQSLTVTSIMYLLNGICKKKKLNKNSSIVLVSSLGALMGPKAGGLYCAVKAELLALARVWANELSIYGTRANCVAPGIVQTDLLEEAYKRLSAEEVEADRQKYPLGYGTPPDVAQPVAFLLSDASKWITGQTIVIDGGRSIYV